MTSWKDLHVKVVGFTGTQQGMTNDQMYRVHELLGMLKDVGAMKAHHGMCVGADDQFDYMAAVLHYWITGHPGVTKDGRVYQRMSKFRGQILLPEKQFLARNHDIVDISDLMLATPKALREALHSGTWATIRYCLKVKKPLFIIWPNGMVLPENCN